MRIVFFGATDLSYSCCLTIHENRLADIAGIFTIPRKFNISYSNEPVTNVLYKDFTAFHIDYGIPVSEVNNRMDYYVDQIKSLQPDLLLVIGWYYMMPNSIRSLAPLGCVGIHSSLLPKYRGGAPLVWSIINGEKETGVTLFYFSDGVDDGDIIAQSSFPIHEKDTIKNVLCKSHAASQEIIQEYIPKIAEGTAPRNAQDHTEATYFPQRKPEDGLIDWTWNAQKINNFIRAQTKPYPGAYTIINGKKVSIWDADIVPDNT